METYSILNDFGNIQPNISQLDIEIKNSIIIVTNFNGVSYYGDTVNIYFDSVLSAPEKIELDNIVSNHIAIFNPSTNYRILISCKTTVKNTTFTRVGTEIFSGSSYATAKCISYMDPVNSSYTVQIYDKTNKQILVSTNFTNTIEGIQDLGVLSNVPTTSSQLEISIKKTGGTNSSKVYIESVTIYYN